MRLYLVNKYLMRVKPLLYLSLLFFITACTHPNGYDVKPVPVEPFTTYLNVLYGTDTTEQVLDAYLPQVRDTVHTPVIILIHGGAWVQGEKEDFMGLGLDTFFTAAGCAVVNMNYRLIGTKYQYPAPLDDVGLVMDFIKQKAAAWQINPNRVCILGRSSGSQLALMYAYSVNANGRVKAVIDGFGPTDFCDNSIVEEPLGVNVVNMLGPYASNMQAWHNASPIFYMAGAVPTTIMQGTVDSTVFPIQSSMLADSLVARGKPCLYFPWVGDSHGWDQTKWLQDRGAVLSWLQNYL